MAKQLKKPSERNEPAHTTKGEQAELTNATYQIRETGRERQSKKEKGQTFRMYKFCEL